MSERISATDLFEQLSGQADQAELYQLRRHELPVTFRAGALESVRRVETTGRALRVIHQDRLGFSATTDVTDDTTVVKNALASAQLSDSVAFDFPHQQPLPSVSCFDPHLEQMEAADLIELGKEVVAKIEAEAPDLQIVIILRQHIDQVRLLNSQGLDLQDRRTLLSLYVAGIQTRGDDVLTVHALASSRQRQGVDGAALAEQILQRLRWSEKIVPVESKPMPVVFNLWGGLVLMWPLIGGLSGREVYMSTSPLSEKLGQQAFDPRLTLIDDGRLDFGPRSAPYDDEGVPTTEKRLIERGNARQFLYDLETASRAGVQSTGSGFKLTLYDEGHHLRPKVNSSNWLVSPGDQSLEQILAELNEALLVEDVLGLGQGNVTAGEFSNNVLTSFLVRRGEVVGRVKDTMIAGNVYDLLRDNLIALSDRTQWVYGMMRLPAIAIDGVSVTSSG